ncbi:oxidoreductase [Actinoallomurus iriomotensis]|uniref:Oxidoreductase n=1 Tax=Actinoallomurus iriomotensis TaxID=478107 RepID=A0A9W6W0I9_9ACTN|nr:oxidoreductase [Actinoallomurus iriomotensis]GLY92363.1 oxidoreductase [Actinoallomurus iriomotensis]
MNDPFAHVAGLPGVPEAVAAAREAVDRLLGHRILRRQSAEVSAESALRGARASAELEGAPASLEDVRAGLVEDPLIQGALRVSASLGSLAPTWRVAPRQALARLHVLAVSGSDSGFDSGSLGRPRASLEATDPLSLGSPPSPSQVAERLSSLSDLLTTPTEAPALVVAAVAQGELLALRPFGSADGLVARAAARLTLIDRGLDPKSLAAPEVGHVELGSAYAEAIRAYVSGTPSGVGQWVSHCAEATALGARDALAVCEAFTRR